MTDGPLMLRGLNDSKQVLPERRAELALEICARCDGLGGRRSLGR